MNVNIKTKVRYKGQEYSDANQLPAEVRTAYEKAMAGDPNAAAKAAVSKKIVFNGKEFASEGEMPDKTRKLYDDIMTVIQDNGQVTLPVYPPEPLLTKRQLRLVLVLVGTVLLAALIILAKSLPLK